MQAVQTTEVAEVHPNHINDVSFVIPYMSVMDDSHMLEVSGMELVRVLHGRVQNSMFEEVFTPSFPSNYDSWHKENFQKITNSLIILSLE
jgi:hypothetical protein